MTARGSRGTLWNRRTIATLIFLAWIGSLTWLVDRHYLSGGRLAPGASPRWPVPPGSAFMSVALAGRQVGLATLSVDTLPEGLRVTELVTIDLPRVAPGTPRRTSYRTEAMYSRRLQLLRFQVDLLSEHGRSRTEGLVTGDSLLTLIANAPGGTADTEVVHLRRPIVLASAVPLVAASRGLGSPGSRLNVEVYDPLDQELRVERLTITAESTVVVPDSAEFNENLQRWDVVHGDTLRAWRFDHTEQGLPVSFWVDDAGMPVRVVNRMGAVFERSAFEIIQTNYRNRPPPVWDSSASAPRYLVGTGVPPVRRSMQVLAHLAPDASLPADSTGLTGGWQVQVGDTIDVGPHAAPEIQDSSTIPAPPRLLWSLASPDSTIEVAAAKIVGREQRPAAMAILLTAAVRQRIRLRPNAILRSAPHILASGSGNAQERAYLLVSLARAAGLQARVVWGLIWQQGRWELGPWTEIWTGDWTPYDVALMASDAGRLRLGTGGNSRFLTLALRAGRLRARVIEEQP